MFIPFYKNFDKHISVELNKEATLLVY